MAAGHALGALAVGYVLLTSLWDVLIDSGKRSRRTALAAWAQERNLAAYDADQELGWMDGFKLRKKGVAHKGLNGYQGDVGGHAFGVFELQFTTFSKGFQHLHKYSVCSVDTPLEAPNLFVRRQGKADHLFDRVGGTDIDFESDAFSRSFWVTCDDRRFAYDVLHPRMLEHLLVVRPDFLQWRGDLLLVFAPGALEPARADRLMNTASGLLSHLPRHLE